MRCSVLFNPLRWWLRDPTWGHRLMYPLWPDRECMQIRLRCSKCLRTWVVLFEHE